MPHDPLKNLKGYKYSHPLEGILGGLIPGPPPQESRTCGCSGPSEKLRRYLYITQTHSPMQFK